MSNSVPNLNDDPTEREKWTKETEYRDREILVKEKDVVLRAEEIQLKQREQATAGWKSPLVVAIMAATLAALGNAVVAVVNGNSQRDLEDQRSEQLRILEMIKTGNADKAAENLQFLLETGLITDEARKEQIQRYLNERKPGSGPTLPAGSEPVSIAGGITGFDDAVPVSSLPPSRIRTAAQAVGKLFVVDRNGIEAFRCTAFLVADSLAVTAGFCLDDVTSARLVLSGRNGESSYKVEIPAQELVSQAGTPGYTPGNTPDYAVLKVPGKPGAVHGILRLAQRPPHTGQSLALIMFRTNSQMAVINAPDCLVIKIQATHLFHRCDTGGGSAGAPILSADGTQVFGVSYFRSSAGGGAMRADVILRESNTLRAQR